MAPPLGFAVPADVDGPALLAVELVEGLLGADWVCGVVGGWLGTLVCEASVDAGASVAAVSVAAVSGAALPVCGAADSLERLGVGLPLSWPTTVGIDVLCIPAEPMVACPATELAQPAASSRTAVTIAGSRPW